MSEYVTRFIEYYQSDPKAFQFHTRASPFPWYWIESSKVDVTCEETNALIDADMKLEIYHQMFNLACQSKRSDLAELIAHRCELDFQAILNVQLGPLVATDQMNIVELLIGRGADPSLCDPRLCIEDYCEYEGNEASFMKLLEILDYHDLSNMSRAVKSLTEQFYLTDYNIGFSDHKALRHIDKLRAMVSRIGRLFEIFLDHGFVVNDKILNKIIRSNNVDILYIVVRRGYDLDKILNVILELYKGNPYYYISIGIIGILVRAGADLSILSTIQL